MGGRKKGLIERGELNRLEEKKLTEQISKGRIHQVEETTGSSALS